MHILGISGSLREGSYNTGLLRTAAVLVPAGVTFSIASIRDIPFYDGDIDNEQQPEAVTTLKEQIASADGVILATPEYNYSYSGVLKNAIDWMTRGTHRPLIDKPVAVVGASPGNFGAVRAQTDLRRLMSSVSGLVLPRPELLVSNVNKKVDEQGIIIDEATRKVYQTLLESFVAFIKHAQTKQA